MTLQRLSGIDTAFLKAESATTPLHMLAAMILDPDTVPGGYSFEKLREFLAERLHTVPPLQRLLAEVPFDLAAPVWVEGVEADLDLHLRRAAVPAPGSPRELSAIASDLFTHRLDRRRPLWEMVVVEGLEAGRIAILAKLHHALMDGSGGMQFMGSFLSPQSSHAAPAERPPERRKARRPSPLRLLGGAAIDAMYQPGRLARASRSALDSALRVARERFEEGEAPVESPDVPRTILNHAVSRHRQVAFGELPLDVLKKMGHATGTTVNDLLLAVLAGALREYLASRDALPAQALVAGVPVSVRDEAGMEDLANAVSILYASLATDIADPVKRLHAIAQSTRDGKRRKSLMSADLMKDLAEVPAPLLFTLAMRAYWGLGLAERLPPLCNVVLSNVPGPPIDLYFAGARILDIYPLGPVYDGVGLNVTALSNRERVDLGLVACRRAVPDLWTLAEAIQTCFEELRRAVLDGSPTSR